MVVKETHSNRRHSHRPLRAADPLYKYLKEQKGGLLTDEIKWNFSKFLIDREGQVVKRWAPIASFEQIEADILATLEA